MDTEQVPNDYETYLAYHSFEMFHKQVPRNISPVYTNCQISGALIYA